MPDPLMVLAGWIGVSRASECKLNAAVRDGNSIALPTDPKARDRRTRIEVVGGMTRSGRRRKETPIACAPRADFV